MMLVYYDDPEIQNRGLQTALPKTSMKGSKIYWFQKNGVSHRETSQFGWQTVLVIGAGPKEYQRNNGKVQDLGQVQDENRWIS